MDQNSTSKYTMLNG